MAAAIKDGNTAHVYSVSPGATIIGKATGFMINESDLVYNHGGGLTTGTNPTSEPDNGRDTDVFLAERGSPTGTVPGLNTPQVPDPLYLIAFHEICGHSLQGQSGPGPYAQSLSVSRENEIRRYMDRTEAKKVGQRDYSGTHQYP